MNKSMGRFALLSLFTASRCFAQEHLVDQTPPAPQPAAHPDPVPQPQEAKEIIIPAGTRVALTLTNPIRSQFAHRGDSVRAVTAFPVAIGDRVAIPSGTYVDGTIDKVTKRGASGHGELHIHFTHMVFAGGYAVPLDTPSTLARNLSSRPYPGSLAATSAGGGDGLVGGLAFQQFPPPPQTLTPPPRPGPNPAVFAGISLGATAALIITGVALHHRHSGDILFEAGSQFEMVLTNDLSIDPSRVGVVPQS